MAKERSYTSLGARLVDLDRAWQDRLDDSTALVNAGRHAAGLASGIYAVEIRLKVLICKKLDLPALPRIFELHDLEALLTMAGLSRKIHSKSAVTRQVKKNWDAIVLLSGFLNDLRYQPDTLWPGPKVRGHLEQIGRPPHGVIPWLSKQR